MPNRSAPETPHGRNSRVLVHGRGSLQPREAPPYHSVVDLRSIHTNNTGSFSVVSPSGSGTQDRSFDFRQGVNLRPDLMLAGCDVS